MCQNPFLAFSKTDKAMAALAILVQPALYMVHALALSVFEKSKKGFWHMHSIPSVLPYFQTSKVCMLWPSQDCLEALSIQSFSATFEKFTKFDKNAKWGRG